MAKLLESVPNFSEGRDQTTIDMIANAIRGTGGSILDIHSDADHNRSVFTVVGEQEVLVESIYQGVKAAVERIDLRRHTGAHPRLGAADVVPFIPMLDSTMEEAISAARHLGSKVSEDLDLPVYFYEEAASSPERVNLEKVRRKGFEELRDTIGSDPSRAPDLGRSEVHVSAGAIVIGARRPLIAYNIYLNTSNLIVAQSIARSIRHSTGGLRYVKALGFEIPERSCVQVSMNLTYFQRSAIHTVFEMVKEAAASFGVAVTESEIVGLVPAEALIDAAKHYLRMHEFDSRQVLELQLVAADSPTQ